MAPSYLYTNYPDAIDTSNEIPIATDNVTQVNAEIVNRYREAILAIEGELGIQPSGTWATVRARLDAIETSTDLNEILLRLANLESAVEIIQGDINTIQQDILDLQEAILYPQVVHQVLTASVIKDGSNNATIDFNNGLSVTLILDFNLNILTLTPITLASDRASIVRINVKQAGGGTKTVTTWTGPVFIGGTPELSTVAGEVDVITAVIDGTDDTMRFVASIGAAS